MTYQPKLCPECQHPANGHTPRGAVFNDAVNFSGCSFRNGDKWCPCRRMRDEAEPDKGDYALEEKP